MRDANRAARRAAGFGRRWGVPILVGSAGGLVYVVLALDPLADRFGAVAGGALAGLAGIGLGLLASVFVAMLGQLPKAAPAAGRQ